jgi:hypothetical protein
LVLVIVVKGGDWGSISVGGGMGVGLCLDDLDEGLDGFDFFFFMLLGLI